MCKDPPVEEVQPRWWDSFNESSAPPSHPLQFGAAPLSPHFDGISPFLAHFPNKGAAHGNALSQVTSQRDTIVVDTPTELRCFTHETYNAAPSSLEKRVQYRQQKEESSTKACLPPPTVFSAAPVHMLNNNPRSSSHPKGHSTTVPANGSKPDESWWS